MDRWDIFVSYARRDIARVRPLAAALADRGLRVFVDEHSVRDFRSLSRIIGTELGHAKALLAYYSAAYPTRRACQWELTVAYLAGQQEGDPLRRVLVVNPEPTASHIHPVELRDTRSWPGAAGEAIAAHARQVATHVAGLTSPIGHVSAAAPPRWLPAPRPVRTRSAIASVTVSLDRLWQLHSALHPQAAPMLTGRAHAGLAVLRGPGGSALAEEYAVRFGAAFPGGVFWLSLAEQADPVSAYARQVARICAALGLPSSPDDPATALSRLAVAFEQPPHPRLWVVDAVPAGLGRHEFALLTAPHPMIATLVATGSTDYDQYGEPIEVIASPATATIATMATSETTGERERLAAFDLQVELVTRVGVQRLAADSGSLREALDSLYGLFRTTRDVLRGYGPVAPAVHSPAETLLNDVLRPFLSRWHPRLSDHEVRRPAELTPWEHEQSWPEAARLRAELAALAGPLNEVVSRLAAISGTDLGATERQ